MALLQLTKEELREIPATELLKRKGFGLKALCLAYEELRLSLVAKEEAYEELWSETIGG